MIRSLLLRRCAPLLLLTLAACAGNGQVRSAGEPPGTQVVAAEAASTVTAEQPTATAIAHTAVPAPSLATAEAGEDVVASADVAVAAAQTPASDSIAAPTQAEADYAAIYGTDPASVIADPTLPEPVQLPITYDPWEPFNRKMHAFNNVLDRRVATPLARAYIAVVPRPMRLGVSNFFNNLSQPASALNALLQARPGQAGQSLGRFAINSTLGLAGFFDPATTQFNIPNRSEDFGQTLGKWGWRRSRYLELPLFGPRTMRDVFGMAGDSPLSPLPHIADNRVRFFVQGLQLVDIRTQLMAIDSMRVGAVDEYALYRDAWMQRRHYQIFGDDPRQGENQDNLPDYLREDVDLPLVPIDAVPIQP